MRVLIRADGTRDIGFGHIMRMVALAEHLQHAGDEVWLASTRLDATLESRLAARAISVIRGDPMKRSPDDARWVEQRARELSVDWVVADGYDFDARFQEVLRDTGLRLLLVDDSGHCSRYCADLVLNQNLHADPRLYANCSTHTRLLLGASYVLLRREFVDRAPDCVAVSDNARHVLVTMGGSNPVNVIEKVVLALAGIDDPAMKVRVLVWPGDRRLPDLAKRIADPRIELEHAGDAMAETMQWADIAIAGAGTTTYELCFMGVPTLLVKLAENQNGVARAMEKESICIDLGRPRELDADTMSRHIRRLRESPEERLRMSSRGREVVDGRGGARVIEAMVQAS